MNNFIETFKKSTKSVSFILRSKKKKLFFNKNSIKNLFEKLLIRFIYLIIYVVNSKSFTQNPVWSMIFAFENKNYKRSFQSTYKF